MMRDTDTAGVSESKQRHHSIAIPIRRCKQRHRSTRVHHQPSVPVKGTPGLSEDHQDGIRLNTQVVGIRHLKKKEEKYKEITVERENEETQSIMVV